MPNDALKTFLCGTASSPTCNAEWFSFPHLPLPPSVSIPSQSLPLTLIAPALMYLPTSLIACVHVRVCVTAVKWQMP